MYINIKIDSSVKHLTKAACLTLSNYIQNGTGKLMLILLFSFIGLTASAQYTPPYAVYKPITPSRNKQHKTTQYSRLSKIWEDYWRQQTSYKIQIVDGIYQTEGQYKVNRFKLKIYENGKVRVSEYLKNGKWRDAGNTPIRELITIPKALEGIVTSYASVYGFGDVYF